mmetsp:Transcript_5062/g.7836  ORF Transcript_5062/g.7836 Transcript_5062/m.7836 type:complete len:122 (+) Transcript_5062:3-368(+)
MWMMMVVLKRRHGTMMMMMRQAEKKGQKKKKKKTTKITLRTIRSSSIGNHVQGRYENTPRGQGQCFAEISCRLSWGWCFVDWNESLSLQCVPLVAGQVARVRDSFLFFVSYSFAASRTTGF